MAYTLLERTDSESLSSAAFALDGASSTSTWLLPAGQGTGTLGAITANDLAAVIVQILGTTAFAPGDGRLQRTLPICDPCFPWLFADKINQIRGKGTYVTASAPETLEAPPLPNFALYSNYEFTINFTPRPYPVFSDASVMKSSQAWTNFSGHSQSYMYVSEYERFTDYQLSPAFEELTGQLGNMQFFASSSANTQQFQGSPKMMLPNQSLKITWYGVPYRYVSSYNSYFPFFVGCINQRPFTVMGETFWPGELLYIGYNPVKYTPCVPSLAGVVPGVFSTDKLCNIEMHFLVTKRACLDPPSTGVTPVNVNLDTGLTIYGDNLNLNFILAGWNLLPWFPDRRFHYARSNINATQFPGLVNTPSWYSFPMELLFYDPDGASAYQVSTAWA